MKSIILPLAGSLSASGQFNLFLMVAAATIGSLGGASILYSIGRWGGENRIGNWLDRYGKWFLLSRSDLERSREWFARYGSPAVLIARVIPGMRSFVSVPAGLACWACNPAHSPRIANSKEIFFINPSARDGFTKSVRRANGGIQSPNCIPPRLIESFSTENHNLSG